MNLSKNLHWYLLSILLFGFVILAFLSEGTAGGPDDLNHYLHARWAFDHPEFFWNTKAKTVFVALRAPVALLGFDALRVYNVILGIGTALLTMLTARKLNYRPYILAIIILVFAPVYTVLMLSGMNEIMFSFFLILGIYLYLRDFSVWSAVVISLLPMIRTEGFVVFPLFFLAYILNRQWRAIPFLMSGFLLISLLGSFHYGDFFWLFTHNPYDGSASDIYGSGELLYFVNHSGQIFGIPFSILILAGLALIPVRFFGAGRGERRHFITEIMVVFLPFLVYFAAHSYVWWKGIGNSVGELRVMAAVFPSAVLLALFGLDRLFRLIRLPGKFRGLASVLLALLLVYIPFKVYRIPIPLTTQQKMIKKATVWLGQMDLTDRKLYYWNPYWWYFLKMNPTDATRIHLGLHEPADPGKNVPIGSLMLWDAHFGPNEGRTPLESLAGNPDFMEIKSFYPPTPFQVLGGYNYELHIFERVENQSFLRRQSILDEMQDREDALYDLTLIYYQDFESEDGFIDNTSLIHENAASGEYSLYVGSGTEFVRGLEIPLSEITRHKSTAMDVRFFIRFENFSAEDPLLLVVSLQDGDKMLYYQPWAVTPKNPGQWEELHIESQLPGEGSGPEILKVYLWNKGGNGFYLDDFTISLKDPAKRTN